MSELPNANEAAGSGCDAAKPAIVQVARKAGLATRPRLGRHSSAPPAGTLGVLSPVSGSGHQFQDPAFFVPRRALPHPGHDMITKTFGVAKSF